MPKEIRPRITEEEFALIEKHRQDQPDEEGPSIGVPIDRWKEKYDVDYIVENVMKKLDPGFMYEKSDIYKLTGLSPSYPGLSAAVDSYTDYYGKAGGKQHFSHPDTVNYYKKKGRLS